MKTNVRIYKPTKTAMQSGRSGRTAEWVLEGLANTPRVPEHLMGWVSAEDTQDQIRLTFDCMNTAVAFAEEKGWTFDVEPPHRRTVNPQSYMSNFDYRPVEYDKATTGSHKKIEGSTKRKK